MRDESSKPPRDSRSTVSAEESLTEALNSLEQMLERRRGLSGESVSSGSEPAPSDGRGYAVEAQEDGQYTIPLLDQVVMPGAETFGAARDPETAVLATSREEALHQEDEEFFRRLVERLANELEVIVHSRVEAALQEASEDIRGRVRNHIEIILPEILDELVHTRRKRS